MEGRTEREKRNREGGGERQKERWKKRQRNRNREDGSERQTIRH